MKIKLVVAVFLILACGCSKGNESADQKKPVAVTGADSSQAPDVEKLFIAGNEYSQKGDFPKAIEAYQKAIIIDKTKPSVHYNLGNAYVASGVGEADYEKAVQEYLIAIELNPLNPDFHRNLGYAYALLKKGDLSKKKHEELLKMSPAHAKELMGWIERGNQKQ
jgi:tetratricopeptide (TPR) repeat protein